MGFQSTLPRRERRWIWLQKNKAKNFNPRSREGSDWQLGEITSKLEHFNPRSREGSD